MKTRYRVATSFFGKPKLVLQIGVEYKRGSYVGCGGDMLPPPSWDENEILTKWRDAKVEDITVLTTLELTGDGDD